MGPVLIAAVGFIFAISALAKLRAPAPLLETMEVGLHWRVDKWPTLAIAGVWALGVLELTVGLGLLIGGGSFRQVAAIFTFGLSALFLPVLVVLYRRRAPCGCLGALAHSMVGRDQLAYGVILVIMTGASVVATTSTAPDAVLPWTTYGVGAIAAALYVLGRVPGRLIQTRSPRPTRPLGSRGLDRRAFLGRAALTATIATVPGVTLLPRANATNSLPPLPSSQALEAFRAFSGSPEGRLLTEFATNNGLLLSSLGAKAHDRQVGDARYLVVKGAARATGSLAEVGVFEILRPTNDAARSVHLGGAMLVAVTGSEGLHPISVYVEAGPSPVLRAVPMDLLIDNGLPEMILHAGRVALIGT